MNDTWKFIGFDLGAESGRCVAAVINDQKISLTEIHRFVTHCINYENGFYWDVLAIFREILEGLSIAYKEFGPEFDGIGIDTWGVDYVLFDREGRILGYPYHYRDSRTDGIMNEAFSILPKDVLYSKSGNQPAQYNTLFQFLAEKKRKLNLLNSAYKFLLMPDFFNYLLSGKISAEYSIASTTNLTDPVSRKWSKELINIFQLPESIFPEILEPGTKLGCILPWISKKTGLSGKIPVYAVAGHDTASAAVSISSSENNQVFLSSGTWSLMGIESDSPILNETALNNCFTNEGGFNGRTLFLKNIIGLWPVQECRRYWCESGNTYDYQQLAELTKTSGYTNAWVDLDDPRFLKPGNMPEKVISFLQETNQTYLDNPGFITGVILESLAFNYRKTIKEIEEITNRKIDYIHIAGGGIKNTLLTQYTADATGKTVMAGPAEGTILGNLCIQAIASGAYSDMNKLRNVITGSFDINTYEPINTGYFNMNEPGYKKILLKT